MSSDDYTVRQTATPSVQSASGQSEEWSSGGSAELGAIPQAGQEALPLSGSEEYDTEEEIRYEEQNYDDDTADRSSEADWDWEFSSDKEDPRPQNVPRPDEMQYEGKAPVLLAPELASMVSSVGAGPSADGWTEDDENALLSSWVQDPKRRTWWQYTHRVPRPEKQTIWLWRLCCRFLRVFPTQIIGGPDSPLQCEGNPILWPINFCQRLQSLILHDIFAADHRLLILSLVYVAMCRVDHRGPVPWGNPTVDAFVDRFLFEMKENDGSRSIDICRKAAAEYCRVKENRTVRSLYDGLFEQIEKMTPEVNVEHGSRTTNMSTFAINYRDLVTLWKAANSIKLQGIPTLSHSWRTFEEDIRDLATLNTAPRTWSEFYYLRRDLELRERRQRLLNERMPSRDTSENMPAAEQMTSEERNSEQTEVAFNPATTDPSQEQMLELVTRYLGAGAAEAASKAIDNTDIGAENASQIQQDPPAGHGKARVPQGIILPGLMQPVRNQEMPTKWKMCGGVPAASKQSKFLPSGNRAVTLPSQGTVSDEGGSHELQREWDS